MLELLFMLVFLATVVILVMSLVHLLRRHPASAVRLLKISGLGLAIYFAVIILVSLTSSQ